MRFASWADLKRYVELQSAARGCGAIRSRHVAVRLRLDVIKSGSGPGCHTRRPDGDSGMSAATSITVRVPLAIRHRRGRRTVVTPDGSHSPTTTRTRADPAMVKALARAFRWKRLLEDGRYASISEIAAAEHIDRGYVGSILRLTLLAPDIIEAILDGRQPQELGLPALLEPFPVEWDQQRTNWFGAIPRPLGPPPSPTPPAMTSPPLPRQC
jgi:hypothetical protein